MDDTKHGFVTPRTLSVKSRTRGLTLVFLISLHLMPLTGFLLGCFSTCLAQEPIPRLKVRHEVWVSSDRVKLMDLFEKDETPASWWKLLEGIDLGKAPSVGNDKFIASNSLRSYLEQLLSSQGFDPASVSIELPPGQVIIKARPNGISKAEIEAMCRKYILEHAPWKPEDMDIQSFTLSGMLDVPDGQVSHVIEANPNERYVGNVILSIHLLVDGKKKRTLKAAGKVQLHQEVVVASRPMRRNETVGESDVQMQRFNVGDAPDRYASNIDQVVGKRLLRDTGQYQPVLTGDLDTPHVLKKGAAVTIVYEQPGLRVSARGQAREDGKAGNTIRVLNTQTNKTVVCEIVDGSTVKAIP